MGFKPAIAWLRLEGPLRRDLLPRPEPEPEPGTLRPEPEQVPVLRMIRPDLSTDSPDDPLTGWSFRCSVGVRSWLRVSG